MSILVLVGSIVLIAVAVWDAFAAVVLPRRVTRLLRPTRLVLRVVWTLWALPARASRTGRWREDWLSIYGPLGVLILLVTWAAAMIVGFALLQWALGAQLAAGGSGVDFGTILYFSGTTLLTLGPGDVVPRSGAARLLTVVEVGMGFGLLALVISYLPVLYQSFSRREVQISTLDEWAGSPPSAGELLRRLGRFGSLASIDSLLEQWERWAAELMETHLSYPILAYYRSQHENQSWLAALTTILDLCALVIAGIDGVPPRPARLAFAMARHGTVDITQMLATAPRVPTYDRLPPADLARLRAVLAEAGVPLHGDEAADARLAELRATYEPYVCALSAHLLMPLPAWLPTAEARDNWQTTAWE